MSAVEELPPAIKRRGRVVRRLCELAEAAGLGPGPYLKEQIDSGETQAQLAGTLSCSKTAVATLCAKYGLAFSGSRIDLDGEIASIVSDSRSFEKLLSQACVSSIDGLAKVAGEFKAAKTFKDFFVLGRRKGFTYTQMASVLDVSLPTFKRRVRKLSQALDFDKIWDARMPKFAKILGEIFDEVDAKDLVTKIEAMSSVKELVGSRATLGLTMPDLSELLGISLGEVKRQAYYAKKETA